MEEKLREFLSRYVGKKFDRSYPVSEDEADSLVNFAVIDGIEQEIIDYGTENPDAPFWDFLDLIRPGLKDGITQEELLLEGDD